MALLVMSAALGTWSATRGQTSNAVARFPAADPKHGAALVSQLGCGTCHVVPGVPSANGNVGPPLTRMGNRVYIAGVLANTPDNMVRWLRHPQQIVPGNAMPDLRVSEQNARDLAAYLETLR